MNKYAYLTVLFVLSAVSQNSFSKNIFNAAFTNDIARVAELISQNKNVVNERDDIGCTPIHYAAVKGCTEAVALLIEKGANINERNDGGWAPIHFAGVKGDTEAIALFIENGANVNERGDGGWTPIHYAAEQGYTEAIALLIEKGANVNERNDIGCTPIYYAVTQGHTEAAALLIEKGANVNERNDDGCTPIHFAGVKGHTEAIALLIENGANVNERNDIGWAPIHCAAVKGYTEAIALLIENGANPNASHEDVSALRIAVYHNDHDTVVELFESADIDVNQRDLALVDAATEGYLEIVKVLLEAGAQPTRKDWCGFSARHYANKNGHKEVAKLIKSYEPITLGHLLVLGGAVVGGGIVASYLIKNGCNFLYGKKV